MPRNIIINSSNYNTSNNCFRYPLPVAQKFENKEVGLTYISIYNSFYNISSAYGNNTIQLNYPIGASYTSYTFTIPDGYYSYNDLNYFLQQQLIANKLYLISGTGTSATNVYYVSIATNAVQYKAQLNFYPVPIASALAGLGLTQPLTTTSPNGVAVPALPTTANNTPQLIFNTAFGSLIGFLASTLPAVPSTTSSSIAIVSTITPQISVVNSLVLTTNLVHNFGLSNPCSTFEGLALTGGFGSLITRSAGSVEYSDVATNEYQYIDIKFYDQNLNAITLLDIDVLIILAIKDKKEIK